MQRWYALSSLLLCAACATVGAVPVGDVPPPQADIEPANMQSMLATHNQVRASVGLPVLRWSGQMAAYAQQWADYLSANNGCQMKHRSHAHANLLTVGENLYWASPTTITWSDGRKETEVQNITPVQVATDWAGERKDYSYASNSCRSGEQCGHYTQMVWRNTTEVGCGMTVCPDKGQLWVCNYNPPGNWIGQKPY